MIKEESLLSVPVEKVLNNGSIRAGSVGAVLQPRYHPGASLSFAYIFISFTWQLLQEEPRGGSAQSARSFRNAGV